MGMQKLLIADNDDIFRTALAEALQQQYQVLCCRDGKEALSLLLQEKPDILVLDLLIPKFDGISLLHGAARAGVLPQVFAATPFVNNYILEALEKLGVCYLMRKPCDIAATAARIRDLQPGLTAVEPTGADPRADVSQLLHTLGIPAKLKGYTYLREAILLIAKDPTQSITKELYPGVGQRCGSTAIHVERSIRNAIAAAWRCRDNELWRRYFPADSSGSVPRPTNGAFISQLAEFLQLEQTEKAC